MASLSEDRILDFLDGRLATGDEEELLHTLAVSPERRQLLREHLRLREITNTLSTHERFSVPEHVTSQLFSTLTTLGYAAPVTTEAILTKAPEFVRARDIEPAAVAVRSGWRMGVSSLVTVSLMSFLLGAGALYVFGSNLGIRRLSQQQELARRNTTPSNRDIVQNQYSVSAASSSLLNVADGGVLNASDGLANASGTSASTIPATLLTHRELNLGDFAEGVLGDNATSTEESQPISTAAPREHVYQLAAKIPGPESARILPDWGTAILSPFVNEQGIISARYGSGPALNGKSALSASNPSGPWSSLSELKFTWHLWKYVTARASMGELKTYELMPDAGAPKQLAPNKYEGLRTHLSMATNTLIGAELGLTLDPLGIPFEATGGIMEDGSTRSYFRGGIFTHFEPIKTLSVTLGIEGIAYTHDVSKSINDQAAAYHDFYGQNPIPTINTPGTELAGFIGPSLEIGWHF